MSRREQREQIFKILFGVEFHSAEELENRLHCTWKKLGEIRQKEADYILNKVSQHLWNIWMIWIPV